MKDILQKSYLISIIVDFFFYFNKSKVFIFIKNTLITKLFICSFKQYWTKL